MRKQLQTTVGLIKENMYKHIFSVDKIEFFETGYKSNNILPDDENPWQKLDGNTRLSGKDKHYWIRFCVDTPNISADEDLYLNIGTSHESCWDADNPQGLLYLNGEIAQGLDINHTQCKIEPDRHYDVYVYMYTSFTKETEKFTFFADLQSVNRSIEKLYYDLSVPFYSALCFNPEDAHYSKIMAPLTRACNLLDLRNPTDDAFMKSVRDCLEFLETEFYGRLCGKEYTATVNCIGHTHIDVAWLWNYAQTREKVQRSFATVLKFMEQYPEYKFMSSQPQLYKYLKEEAPRLYERVKQAVKEGRWEVEGAMWLEADCNLISGESFIRQLLHGKKFIKDEFGKESEILWLPDVFGYSAALPQILKKSGVNKFFTSKISWNDTNKMPYDSFMWQGIDGTEIFTYFLTAQALPENKKPVNYADYVGRLEPKWALGAWKRYQQKTYNDEVLITYGHGDGGGGPTREMLEQQRRLEKGIPGIPKTRQSHAGEFFKRVEDNFNRSCEELGVTPKWVGELYLEFHRGTYTSIAKNKRYNRKSEFALGNLEKLSALGLVRGENYPQAELNNAWETVLLNQFHDVIPGSSVKEVYEDSDKMYAEVLGYADSEMKKRLLAMAKGFSTKKGALVYNPNSFAVSDVFTIEGKKYFAENVPALGFANVELSDSANGVTLTDSSVENKFYRVVFDADFNICSLFDKRVNRELVKSGRVINQLKMYEDRSYDYDAWELSSYYKQKGTCIDGCTSAQAFTDNVGAGFVITREFGDSKIVQKIQLYNALERIDFCTYVDWHESHSILKTEFPLAVSMNKATYEIQFGNLERSTHSNTSWDKAKFEVCGHKWADVSDNGYGVSLLNDCKYGYSCDGEKLTLSLLKASTFPNPQADRGEHTFTYSLLPHLGNYAAGNTVLQAYCLNNPLYAVSVEDNTGNEIPESFVTTDKKNVVVETVKKAENRDSIIVRVYDAENINTTARLNFGFDVKQAYICDMMENRISEIKACDNGIELPVSNFEIITIEIVA